jgi:hypothetical protein
LCTATAAGADVLTAGGAPSCGASAGDPVGVLQALMETKSVVAIAITLNLSNISFSPPERFLICNRLCIFFGRKSTEFIRIGTLEPTFCEKNYMFIDRVIGRCIAFPLESDHFLKGPNCRPYDSSVKADQATFEWLDLLRRFIHRWDVGFLRHSLS